MNVSIRTIRAKSVFTKSALPASDYVINPYGGCLFGCMYCYAATIGRWNHPGEAWGTYLDVKENATEVLGGELFSLHRKTGLRDFGSVFLSSVTDPYVGPEAKWKLTRGCLSVLADFGYTGHVSVLTKSPLVTRDIDVIARLADVSVGCTVTSTDDAVSRFLEVHAPPVAERIRALRALHEAGVRTYAFIGPILPHILNDGAGFTRLLDGLEGAGVSEVWFEHMHLNAAIKGRLYGFLRTNAPNLVGVFEKADSAAYRDSLNGVIMQAMKGRSMKTAFGKPIHHADASRRERVAR